MTADNNTPGFIVPDVGEKSRFSIVPFDTTILYDNCITNNQKVIFFYYCQSNVISETAEQVGAFLGLSARTVKNAWKILEEEGYLELVERNGRVRTYSTIFKNAWFLGNENDKIGPITDEQRCAYAKRVLDREVEEEFGKPNDGVKMYVSIMQNDELTRSEKVVLGRMMNTDNDLYAETAEDMAECLNLHISTVNHARAKLTKLGYIEKVERKFGRTIYKVNEDKVFRKEA
jgi:DNA-binding transcriptional ArsR family regulator